MNDWLVVLRNISPRAPLNIVGPLAEVMEDEFRKGGITTERRQEHFLAQAAHESTKYGVPFGTMEELGGPKYFARYDGRKDLGNVRPGDGNRFHGRGIFQLTGRANYDRYGKKLGLDLLNRPELAADPRISLRLAIAYWNDRKISPLADRDDTLGVSIKINGKNKNGLPNGWEDRKRLLNVCRKLILAPQTMTPLSLMGDPEPMPVPVWDEDAVFEVQCELRRLGYYDVGDPDGQLGDKTKTGIFAFKLQEGIQPLDGELTPVVFERLRTARPREIGEARATATSTELAVKIPEVAVGREARTAAGALAGVTSAGAVVTSAATMVSETMGQFAPYRFMLIRFWNALPVWLIPLLMLAFAGAMIWLWLKNRKVVEKTVEAYNKGARN